MRLANRGRLLLRTPGPVPFGTCICSNVETILSWTCHVYGPFESWTSLDTSILLLDFWKSGSVFIWTLYTPLYRCKMTSLCYDMLCIHRKHNRESIEGYARWKVGKRHGNFGKTVLNHSSISKFPKGGTEPGVRNGKCSLLVCNTRCKCSMETTRYSTNVKLGIKVMKLTGSLIGWEVTVTSPGSEYHLTFVRESLYIAESEGIRGLSQKFVDTRCIHLIFDIYK